MALSKFPSVGSGLMITGISFCDVITSVLQYNPFCESVSNEYEFVTNLRGKKIQTPTIENYNFVNLFPWKSTGIKVNIR